MQRMQVISPCDQRLDVLVAAEGGVSRSQAAKWIADGLCSIDGKVQTKAGYNVKTGSNVVFTIPDAVESTVEKENIPIKILYEDEDVAVVDKPCGMVVHPAAGNESGTLVNALLYAMDSLSGIGGVKRPGIVHRLDKDTSGLLMVAKNDLAHESLSRQLSERTMEKHYLAVVEGRMKEENGEIEKPIDRSKKDRKKMAIDPEGRYALTRWTLVENLREAALLNVHILTGRTHQIRVHMKSIGHPLAGDSIYGLSKGGVRVPRLMLHAYTLDFTHPRSGERLHFEDEPPQAFLAAVEKLRIKG